MILDIGSLMFNINVRTGGTPSWGTDMGQGEGYKFNFENYENLITSLTYSAVDDLQNVKCEFGKGGSRTSDYNIVLAGLYKKVYVNDEYIPDAQFLLIIAKQIYNQNGFHIGRRTLKYSPNMTYKDEKINEKCFNMIREKLGLNDNSAWFVYEIISKNQDEIHLSVIVADADKDIMFENAGDRKKYIKSLISLNDNVDEKTRLDNCYELTENKSFVFNCIDILLNHINENRLGILLSKEKSKENTKHFREILREVTNIADENKLDELSKDENNYLRYYKDKKITIENRQFIVSNDWYPEQRAGFIDYIKRIIDEDIKAECKGGKNTIYYGVPGTGKSYEIDNTELKNVKNENKIRITFHPEYSYNDFIGQLLPKVEHKENGEEYITYDFKKGPFTLALERAYEKPQEAVHLIIEEMSRGNCAAIFGDIFQLLDRDDDGISRYSVDNDVIAKDIPQISDNKIKIPSNLYIWGTVNTSDQNVFVMDTAFKRRFDWKYINTKPKQDENSNYLNNIEIVLNDGISDFTTNWINLYQSINIYISSKNKLGLGEDKQIGQFFMEFKDGTYKEKIRDKLLHYLWFDVQENSYSEEVRLFDKEITCFSDLYDYYDNDRKIFSTDFINYLKSFKG